MDNLIQPFLTNPIQKSRGGKYVGVNGENKWLHDVSSDFLTHSKRPGSGEQHGQLALINYHLMELVDFLKVYKNRLEEKDKKDRVAKEWKAAGLIFDRIFFLVYLSTIVVSMCVLLPIITLTTHESNVKFDSQVWATQSVSVWMSLPSWYWLPSNQASIWFAGFNSKEVCSYAIALINGQTSDFIQAFVEP